MLDELGVGVRIVPHLVIRLLLRMHDFPCLIHYIGNYCLLDDGVMDNLCDRQPYRIGMGRMHRVRMVHMEGVGLDYLQFGRLAASEQYA